MLKIQQNSVEPLLLYSFLEQQIGKLYMTIKSNRTIIKFINPEHYQLALHKYSSFTLKGQLIEIKPYNGQPQANREKAVVIDESVQTIGDPLSWGADPQMNKLIESFRMNSEYNEIDKIIMKYRKIMVEYVCNYDLFYKTMQSKIGRVAAGSSHQRAEAASNSANLNSNIDNREGNMNGQPQGQIEMFLQRKLKGLFKQIKDDFKKVNANLKQYGNERKIVLEPQILKDSNSKDKLLNHQAYSPFVQYINSDIATQAYRLKPLNSSQFAITTICKPQHSKPQSGKLKIYNINNQHQQNSLLVKEKIYGLLTLENYILAGNDQGYIAYLSRQKINKYYLSTKLYGNEIKQIMMINERGWGYNIATLGRFAYSNRVKWIEVREEEIYQNQRTLFFDEKMDIPSESNVFCLERGFQDNTLFLGNEKSVVLYDLLKCKATSKLSMNYQICKIKKMKQSKLLSVANKNYISIIDNQTNQFNNYNFYKNITSICPINDYAVVYGSVEGEVGLFDLRKTGNNKVVWSNRINHKARIYDIVQVDQYVVSCDNQGQIVSWAGNH